MGQEGSKGEDGEYFPEGYNGGGAGGRPPSGGGPPGSRSATPLNAPGRTGALFGEDPTSPSGCSLSSVPGTPAQERRPKMMAGDTSNLAKSSQRVSASPLMTRSLTSMRSAPAGSPALSKSSSLSRGVAPPRSLSLSSAKAEEGHIPSGKSSASPESPSPTGEIRIIPSRERGDKSPDPSVRYLSRSPRSGTNSPAISLENPTSPSPRPGVSRRIKEAQGSISTKTDGAIKVPNADMTKASLELSKSVPAGPNQSVGIGSNISIPPGSTKVMKPINSLHSKDDGTRSCHPKPLEPSNESSLEPHEGRRGVVDSSVGSGISGYEPAPILPPEAALRAPLPSMPVGGAVSKQTPSADQTGSSLESGPTLLAPATQKATQELSYPPSDPSELNKKHQGFTSSIEPPFSVFSSPKKNSPTDASVVGTPVSTCSVDSISTASTVSPGGWNEGVLSFSPTPSQPEARPMPQAPLSRSRPGDSQAKTRELVNKPGTEKPMLFGGEDNFEMTDAPKGTDHRGLVSEGCITPGSVFPTRTNITLPPLQAVTGLHSHHHFPGKLACDVPTEHDSGLKTLAAGTTTGDTSQKSLGSVDRETAVSDDRALHSGDIWDRQLQITGKRPTPLSERPGIEVGRDIKAPGHSLPEKHEPELIRNIHDPNSKETQDVWGVISDPEPPQGGQENVVCHDFTDVSPELPDVVSDHKPRNQSGGVHARAQLTELTVGVEGIYQGKITPHIMDHQQEEAIPTPGGDQPDLPRGTGGDVSGNKLQLGESGPPQNKPLSPETADFHTKDILQPNMNLDCEKEDDHTADDQRTEALPVEDKRGLPEVNAPCQSGLTSCRDANILNLSGLTALENKSESSQNISSPTDSGIDCISNPAMMSSLSSLESPGAPPDQLPCNTPVGVNAPVGKEMGPICGGNTTSPIMNSSEDPTSGSDPPSSVSVPPGMLTVPSQCQVNATATNTTSVYEERREEDLSYKDQLVCGSGPKLSLADVEKEKTVRANIGESLSGELHGSPKEENKQAGRITPESDCDKKEETGTPALKDSELKMGNAEGREQNQENCEDAVITGNTSQELGGPRNNAPGDAEGHVSEHRLTPEDGISGEDSFEDAEDTLSLSRNSGEVSSAVTDGEDGDVRSLDTDKTPVDKSGVLAQPPKATADVSATSDTNTGPEAASVQVKVYSESLDKGTIDPKEVLIENSKIQSPPSEEFQEGTLQIKDGKSSEDIATEVGGEKLDVNNLSQHVGSDSHTDMGSSDKVQTERPEENKPQASASKTAPVTPEKEMSENKPEIPRETLDSKDAGSSDTVSEFNTSKTEAREERKFITDESTKVKTTRPNIERMDAGVKETDRSPDNLEENNGKIEKDSKSKANPIAQSSDVKIAPRELEVEKDLPDDTPKGNVAYLNEGAIAQITLIEKSDINFSEKVKDGGGMAFEISDIAELVEKEIKGVTDVECDRKVVSAIRNERENPEQSDLEEAKHMVVAKETQLGLEKIEPVETPDSAQIPGGNIPEKDHITEPSVVSKDGEGEQDKLIDGKVSDDTPGTRKPNVPKVNNPAEVATPTPDDPSPGEVTAMTGAKEQPSTVADNTEPNLVSTNGASPPSSLPDDTNQPNEPVISDESPGEKVNIVTPSKINTTKMEEEFPGVTSGVSTEVDVHGPNETTGRSATTTGEEEINVEIQCKDTVNESRAGVSVASPLDVCVAGQTKITSENNRESATRQVEAGVIHGGSTDAEREASSENKPDLGSSQGEAKLCGKAGGNTGGTGEAAGVVGQIQVNSTGSQQVTNTDTTNIQVDTDDKKSFSVEDTSGCAMKEQPSGDSLTSQVVGDPPGEGELNVGVLEVENSKAIQQVTLDSSVGEDQNKNTVKGESTPSNGVTEKMNLPEEAGSSGVSAAPEQSNCLNSKDKAEGNFNELSSESHGKRDEILIDEPKSASSQQQLENMEANRHQPLENSKEDSEPITDKLDSDISGQDAIHFAEEEEKQPPLNPPSSEGGASQGNKQSIGLEEENKPGINTTDCSPKDQSKMSTDRNTELGITLSSDLEETVVHSNEDAKKSSPSSVEGVPEAKLCATEKSTEEEPISKKIEAEEKPTSTELAAVEDQDQHHEKDENVGTEAVPSESQPELTQEKKQVSEVSVPLSDTAEVAKEELEKSVETKSETEPQDSGAKEELVEDNLTKSEVSEETLEEAETEEKTSVTSITEDPDKKPDVKDKSESTETNSELEKPVEEGKVESEQSKQPPPETTGVEQKTDKSDDKTQTPVAEQDTKILVKEAALKEPNETVATEEKVESTAPELGKDLSSPSGPLSTAADADSQLQEQKSADGGKDSDSDEFEDCVAALPESQTAAKQEEPIPESSPEERTKETEDQAGVVKVDDKEPLAEDPTPKEALQSVEELKVDTAESEVKEDIQGSESVSPKVVDVPEAKAEESQIQEPEPSEVSGGLDLTPGGPTDESCTDPEPDSQSHTEPTPPSERPIKPASFDFNNLDELIGSEPKETPPNTEETPSVLPPGERPIKPASFDYSSLDEHFKPEDIQTEPLKEEDTTPVPPEELPRASPPAERPIKPANFDFSSLDEHFNPEDIGAQPADEGKPQTPSSGERPIKPASFDYSSVADEYPDSGALPPEPVKSSPQERPIKPASFDFSNLDELIGPDPAAAGKSDSSSKPDIEEPEREPPRSKSPSAERPLRPAKFDFNEVDENTDPFGGGSRLSSSPPIRPAKFDYSQIDETIDPFGSGNTSEASAPPKRDVKKAKVVKPIRSVKGKKAVKPKGSKVDPPKEQPEDPVPGDTSAPISIPQTQGDPSPVMDDNAPAPDSPPVMARGTYNFDFDSFDENTNPFAAKNRMSKSPPKPSEKPSSLDINGGEIDPFKPGRALRNSPPGSPTSKLADAIDNNLPPESSSTTTTEDNTPASEPKKVLKKKVMRKKPPQAKTTVPKRSKFKPPTNFGKKPDGAEEDIQIYVPELDAGADNPVPVTDLPESDMPLHTSDKTERLQEPESLQLQSKPPLADSLQTPDSLGGDSASQSSSQYENGVESSQSDIHSYEANGEDFQRPQGVLNDSAAWDMLNKCGANNDYKEPNLGRQSLYMKFDSAAQESEAPAANAGAQWDMINKYDSTNGEIKDSDRQSLYVKAEEAARSANTPALPKALARLKPQPGTQHDSSSDDLLLNTPPNKTKHPQVRALGEPSEGTTGDEKHDVPKDVYAFSPANPDHENLPSLHSSVGCSSEMSTSREQTIPPDMSSSWLESVNSYNELEGDSAILSDSLDCGGGLVGWAQTQAENGRPESPLQFDHEEVLRIDTDQQSEASAASPMRSNGEAGSMDSVDIMQVVKYSQADMNRMRKELELELQAKLLSKERDWQKHNEEVVKERDALKQANTEMGTIVVEYERSIAQTIELGLICSREEKEDSLTSTKDTLKEVSAERDQALEDLQSVESAFSDLHRRFEKTKATVENFKRNEITLKKCVADLQAKLKKQEQKNQLIKEKAEEKIESLGSDMEKMRKEHQTEAMRLQAATRKLELQTSSLETALEQKTRENKELTAICDELISKVGAQ